MDNIINNSSFGNSGYEEYEKAAILFGISDITSKSLYNFGMKFNFETLNFVGFLKINDTEIRVGIHLEQDSHAKKYTIFLRDKNGNYLSNYKGRTSIDIYYKHSFTEHENNIAQILRIFVENFYLLNNKNKETFTEFVNKEKTINTI